MFCTIGDSSLLASGQESWMHGSQSFLSQLREPFQYFNYYSSELLILRSALINIKLTV